MKSNIITISREFGSGGRTIGKKLSEVLKIPYYDKELVKQVSDKTGFDPKFIEENGEFSSTKSFFSFAAAQGIPCMQNGLSISDFIFCMQRDIILKFAETPCVIVGRCADYILRDREDCLNVLVHADMDFRADRIVRLYGESEKKPEQRLHEKDKKRKIYYKHYTDREWGAASNYDICLNSGKIGIDNCVDLILSVVNNDKDI